MIFIYATPENAVHIHHGEGALFLDVEKMYTEARRAFECYELVICELQPGDMTRYRYALAKTRHGDTLIFSGIKPQSFCEEMPASTEFPLDVCDAPFSGQNPCTAAVGRDVLHAVGYGKYDRRYDYVTKQPKL